MRRTLLAALAMLALAGGAEARGHRTAGFKAPREHRGHAAAGIREIKPLGPQAFHPVRRVKPVKPFSYLEHEKHPEKDD